MNNQQQFPEEENFSNDPEDNLKMQNDFLKLKMMAESGAVFGGEGSLPADIENEFLKNIIEFEKANANAKSCNISGILGKPVFEDEKNLDENKFHLEFLRLQKLLKNHSLNVEFIRPRDERFKYNFITKELFYHETTFLPVKGMNTYFSYEEFHPDHEWAITDLASRFLNDFLERKLDANTYYINDEFIAPDRSIISREELMKRFELMYETVPEFENASFHLENSDFEIDQTVEKYSGMGFSEGSINYDLIFRDGRRKEIRGPFKIYFSRDQDCWGICFFYLPGFNLHSKKEEE